MLTTAVKYELYKIYTYNIVRILVFIVCKQRTTEKSEIGKNRQIFDLDQINYLNMVELPSFKLLVS